MKTGIILGILLVIASSVFSQQPADSLSSGRSERNRFSRHYAPDSLSRRYGRTGSSRRRWENAEARQRFMQHRQSLDGLGYVQLSAEQKKRVFKINQQYQQESASLYRNDDLTLREYKTRLVAIQKERKSKIEALLTSQQKENRTTALKQRAENEQVRAAARLERMRIRLNLNTQQTADLKAQHEKFHQQLEAIRHNDDLLPMQKNDQVRTLMMSQRDALKDILTPQQFSQWEMMHKQRFSRS